MTITAGAIVMFKNDFVGFAAGYAYLGLLRLQEQYMAYRARRDARLVAPAGE